MRRRRREGPCSPRLPRPPFRGTLIRVAIVEELALLRRGWRLLLDAKTDLEVVRESATASDLLAHVGEWDPDVVVARQIPAQLLSEVTHRWTRAAAVILSR